VQAGANPAYRIQAGDVLDVRFYTAPELSTQTAVRSDGKISLTPVGDIDAAGLQPAELSQLISQRFARELIRPGVTVTVRTFGAQIYVGGEVHSPSALPLHPGMTTLQAIDGAGGFLDSAAVNGVVLIRGAGPESQRFELDLERALSGEDALADMSVQPGDTVYVPRSRIGAVNFFVDRYIRKNLPVPPTIPVL
jgi:protein involved in polysaccharide export with SLBB domain